MELQHLQPRLLELKESVLSKNDQLADDLRERFAVAGVFVMNWVSSPGSGKTALLESTLRLMRERGIRVAALVGDLATENDAQRLLRSGAPVRQIVTAGLCHLEADMVSQHLHGWDMADYDFLFIENVGNLVCPSSYDLGESLRVVLMSVTEGEDKPLKYPTSFNSADVVAITKIDLAEAVEFDREAAYANIHAVSPFIPILETSAKRGAGMTEWIEFLVNARKKMIVV
jgi:hydrogenase nickel incorporation protein HypB